jgi:hypothetical protein
MNTSESMQALRRANPRGSVGFASSVDAAATAVRATISAADAAGDATVQWEHDGHPGPRRSRPRVRAAWVSLAAAAAAGVAVAAFLATGAPSGSPPAVATRPATAPAPATVPAPVTLVKAAEVSGSLADQSGTAVVRIVHNGRPWAGSTVRWSGRDLSVSRSDGEEFRVVGGIFYAFIAGRWVSFSNPDDLTWGSGTSPADYLATLSEDAGGATLHRIVASMTGQTTRHLADGTTVYSGTVPAGEIARTQGHKEGQTIRVLPFGYVAHDEAADPAAPLAVRLTVGADGIIRLISVHWGSNSSAWDYTVAYRGLGHTPAPVAPENATTPQPIDTSSPGPRPSQ